MQSRAHADIRSPMRPTHEEVIGELPAYATELLLGGDAARRFPHVASHLAACEECAVQLSEILALMQPLYDGEIALDPQTPAFDLHFLQEAPPGWWRDAGNRIVVALPRELTQGATSGPGARCQVQIPPPEPLLITFEILRPLYPHDGVTLQISVERPGQDPLGQPPITLMLTADGHRWVCATDQGVAIVEGLPSELVPGLQMTIESPHRTAHSPL